METSEQTDTIPRLRQLWPHMRAQLIGMKDGATFEQARLRYIRVVDDLVAAGKGRKTASRVGDRDAYWAPTMEVLDECMRLGFLKRCPLPSARRYLDKHRNTRFELTAGGREAAELAESDPARFMDLLSNAVVRGHPYFSALLMALQEAPLLCPEVSEKSVEALRQEGRGTAEWAAWATDEIRRGPGGEAASCEEVREEVVKALRKRFGGSLTERPTAKALAEAFNDACAVAALRTRGLRMGATELKQLKAWGSQLLVLDESRQVPEFNGHNVVWLAADVRSDGDGLQIRRRGAGEFGAAVAQAIVDAYRHQAEGSESELAAPYLAIHRVRAEAAFAKGVTRSLVDIVLEQLASGQFPDLGVEVYLHLGRGDQPPPSEPPYRRRGSRMYEMTMVEQRKFKARSKESR